MLYRLQSTICERTSGWLSTALKVRKQHAGPESRGKSLMPAAHNMGHVAVAHVDVQQGGRKGRGSFTASSSENSSSVAAVDTSASPCGPKIVEGYVGKPKGMRQILWERGLWIEGMTADSLDPKLNIKSILSSCTDFRNEKTALQALFEDRGHILLMSPKCHPELAGVGIEYSWGKSKLEFRRRINDQVPANLQQNVIKSLSVDVLPLSRIRKFARRTRDYRRHHVYSMMKNQSDSENGFQLIENIASEAKNTHRNIVDLEMKYLLRV
eukprot:Pompholyxophrys_punicea_v1_NODE_290_length_2356_cov_40.811280.p1 type:complete len:268 gc:universal NODE_290_length_2356_cov_40.811280:1473-2276(+)